MDKANEAITAVTYLTLEENLIKLKAAIAEKGIDPENNALFFNRKDKPDDLLMPTRIIPVVNKDSSQPNQQAIVVTLKSFKQAVAEKQKNEEMQAVNPQAFIDDIHKLFSELNSDSDDIQVLVGMEDTPENEEYMPRIAIGIDIDDTQYRMGSVENITFAETNNSSKTKNDPNLIIFTFS